MTIGVAVLGSTGSIGTSTLRVLTRLKQRFHVVAITAYGSENLLRQQAASVGAEFVGLVNGAAGSHGCAEVDQACDETLWPSVKDRYGSATVIPSRNECDRQCSRPDLWLLAQQPGGKLAPAVSTTRRGDGKI